jgi:hypothetical protein
MNTQQRNSSPESAHEPATTTSHAIHRRIMEITRLTFARQIPTEDPEILRARVIQMNLLMAEEAMLLREESRLNNRHRQRNSRLSTSARVLRVISAQRTARRHISRFHGNPQAAPETTPEHETN